MRAVVFANGVIPEINKIPPLIADGDFIVSADGGLRYLRLLNILPKLIIGDLDSLSAEDLQFIKKKKIEVLRFPVEKDFTDLELAIKELVRRNFENILVIGALGGRIDQTLANVRLIQYFTQKGITLEFNDGQDHICLVQNRREIAGQKGDTVSLISICERVNGITTDGLKYPLQDETLLVGKTRGISNEMTGNLARINIASGRLLCIHTRKSVEKEN